ncbi:triose-phosphate isomerase [Pelagibius sp. Alg239-R121]|uniref:triose-phosphate isomerase n=1 Tax=Pelagibius sp. Alg239-R121 TaxID=2993448 RepID=UPI0024A75781|nr:triose-phosphate isomerase [Pelagibius sp. Alg239-R121]
MRRKLIAGNWKMNGLRAGGAALAGGLAEKCRAEALTCDFLVCPPAHLLIPVSEAIAGSGIALGGQDCHTGASGAHTGDLSAEMLADVGCSFVILGHSERRADHGEGSDLVQAKALAAARAGLKAIVCVGETADERKAGRALEVIETQIRQSLPEGAGAELVVAYEPVWAIGTGLTATPADVAEVHAQIRQLLVELCGAGVGDAIRILYGGSVKPANAAELMAVDNVDGALVGGASLKLEDFWAIGSSCP